jgi:hypothetical protein
MRENVSLILGHRDTCQNAFDILLKNQLQARSKPQIQNVFSLSQLNFEQSLLS